MPCGCQPEEDFAPSKGSPKAKQFTQTVPPAATQTRVIHASLILESEQLLGQVSPDDDKIDDQINDSFSPWLNQFPSSDPLPLVNISGATTSQFVSSATTSVTSSAMCFQLSPLRFLHST